MPRHPLKEAEEITWKSFKKKGEKSALINIHVTYLANKYGLDDAEYIGLYSLINLGIFTKYIKPDDILLKKGVIHKIKTLRRDKESGAFYLVFEVKNISAKAGCTTMSSRKKSDGEGKKIDIALIKEKYLGYLEKLKNLTPKNKKNRS